jgi:protoporphyrinogen oxidase
MRRHRDDVLVLGAGLAGLSAGHVLARAGLRVGIVEREPAVGGLARTITRGPFRFDLGGHRFFTRDERVDRLVRGLLGDDALTVARKSQIFLRDRYIDYPLSPLNALAGLGAPTALRIVLDHAGERLRGPFGSRQMVSLEDWVVRHFGRTLFEIYFREYSEKVWGIGCDRISAGWAAQRIQGLSLGTAVRNAFSRRSGSAIRSLTDRFLYPSRGIGTIADRLREELDRGQDVLCGAEVGRIRHEGSRLLAAEVREGGRASPVEARSFVSTLPLPDLVRLLDPSPPAQVLAAAASLRWRDLVVVAVLLDRRRATDQSWLYFPERRIPFGRIHEPTNWSARMAPEGRTLLVAEVFCTRGDATWTASDGELAGRTVGSLRELGIVSQGEVLGTEVLRIGKAYPLLEVGHEGHCRTIRGYLEGFRNLFLAGRGGTFSYHNMDHAIASGMDAASAVLGNGVDLDVPRPGEVPERRSA